MQEEEKALKNQSRVAIGMDKNIKAIVLGAMLSLMVMIGVAAIVFLATVRPQDDTVVPRVVGRNLSEAMLLLQNSDLSAYITTRFVDDPALEAGLVLQQRPVAGTHTKVGRFIELNVSAGLALQYVENFIGSSLDEVRTAIVTRYNGLLVIQEPLIYLTSEQPIGTVIGQDPVVGTALSGPTPISFLLSRGSAPMVHTLIGYEGLAFERALALVSQKNLPFIFNIDGDAMEGIPLVINQYPLPGSELIGGESLRLTISPRTENSEGVLGLYTINVPAHSEVMKIELIAIAGNREILLFTTYQQGVTLVAPYYQPVGTQLILRINEIIVETSVVQ